jgi:hypothetical protein
MSFPQGSERFSGIKIFNHGQAFTVHDSSGPVNSNFVYVNTMMRKCIIVGELITDVFTIPGPLVLGSPPVLDPNALVQIYDDDSGAYPQIVVQQAGSGDSSMRFITGNLDGRQFSLGIDSSTLNDVFRISAAASLDTVSVFILDDIAGNIGIGIDATGNTTEENNTCIGNLSGSSMHIAGDNTLIGPSTGALIDTGDMNICLGRNSTGGAGEALPANRSNCILLSNYGFTVSSNGEVHLGMTGDSLFTFIYGSLYLPNEQYENPINGATVVITNTTSIVILDPAVPLAVLTIDMPSNPKNGQFLIITITNTISSVVQNGNGNIIIFPITGNTSFLTRGWYFNDSNNTWYPTSGSITADVIGPSSSLDNSIVRFNGITGKLIQDSGILLDDSNNITDVTSLQISPSTAEAITINVVTSLITSDLRFLELAANGTNYTGFKFRIGGSLGASIMYTLPTADGLAGQVLASDASFNLSWQFNGDVSGPASSTDNAIVRFNGTSGDTIQNSIITIDDSGDFDRSGSDYIHERGGVDNFGFGTNALSTITTGINNTGAGQGALDTVTGEDNNTGIGVMGNRTGTDSVIIGRDAFSGFGATSQAVAIGFRSDAAPDSVSIGYIALQFVGFAAIDSTAIGSNSLSIAAHTGSVNTASGVNVLSSVIGGSNNTGGGNDSLSAVDAGDDNSALGIKTGSVLESGSRNVCVGRLSGPVGAGSLLSISSDDCIMISNNGSSAANGTARIGNTTDHTQAELLSSSSGGVLYRYGTKGFVKTQVTPNTQTDTAVLTIANLLTQIIVGTPTAAASYVLPTATNVSNAFDNPAVDDSFDFHIINLSVTGGNTITITTNTGATLIGNMVVQPNNVATSQSQGHFRIRITTVGSAYTISRVA